MTVLTPAQIVGTALPSLAPSPVSSGGHSSGPSSAGRSGSSNGPAGAGLGGAIKDTWVDAGRAKEIKKRADRRASIAKARKEIEGRTETKAERLARQQGAARLTGSSVERQHTRTSVGRAAAALADVPMDKEFSGEEYRSLRERLRQRYPGRKLSEMLTEAAKLEQMLLDDPVQAREALHAAYSRAQYAPTYVDPKYASGLRGSLQRARLEQQDGEDLKDFIAKYGRRLPQILAELEVMDRALTDNPAHASAKIAARWGAPVIESEIAPYVAKQEAKAQQVQLQAHYNNICKGINLAIEHKIISGKEDDLNAMAEVLHHADFPWDQHKARGEHWELYALRHAHDVAQQLRGSKGKRDPGQMSISGGPGVRQQPYAAARDRGTGGVRDSIARVRGAM
ncbi:hypothetical protein [Bradyrhizobium sp. RDM4]|uniref:hypothetical protein n=1 Tax=Bradyrhizobium sp. RDM4 TaxID=3378765 RepID=UPI0038FC84B6